MRFIVFSLLFFVLSILSVSAGSLSEESSLSCVTVQDDPDIAVDCVTGPSGLLFNMSTSVPGGFGVYTSDLAKTSLPQVSHGQHGAVRRLFNPSQIVSQGNKADFSYFPSKRSERLYFGDSTEIVEVVNESKVIYTENTIHGLELEYNHSLLRCSGSSVNCSIQPHDIDIVTNGPSVYKFGAYDNATASSSSWYQYKVESNYPLIQKNEFVWAARFLRYTACTEQGCTSKYDDYDMDFSGVSAYLLDGDSETLANVTYTYSPVTHWDNTTNTTVFDKALLYINFYSNGTIDPTITSTSTSIASSGHINHSNTRQSSLDNAITLNHSLTGLASVIQPLDLGGNFTVQNTTVVSRQDVQDGSKLITFTYEEGTGTPSSDDGDSPAITTSGTQTFVTSDVAIGEYSYNLSDSSRYYTTAYDNRFNTSTHTMGVWIKTTALGVNEVMYSATSNGGARRFWIYENTDLLISYNGVGTTAKITNANITDGNWHLVVAVWNGTHARAYLDGVEHGSPESYTPLAFATKSQNIGFNSYGGGTFPAAQKLVDSWFIYNDSMTSEEVRWLYNATKSGYLDELANVTVDVRVSSDNVTINYNPPQNNSLVGFWSMDSDDRDATTVFDWTVYNNSGTLVNDATVSAGFIDNSTFFDGVNDYINLGNPSELQLQVMTVSMWVNQDSYTGRNTLFDFGRVINTASRLTVETDGIIKYFLNNVRVLCQGTTTTPLDEWFMVTLTYNGSSGDCRIYHNGELDGNETDAAAFSGWSGFYIGSDNSLTEEIEGDIDQVMFWNTTLSASEVKGLYVDQALQYGDWTSTYNTSEVTGRFVQYRLNFNSTDELFSEYVQNTTIGYETVSFAGGGGGGGPDTTPPTILIIIPVNGTQMDNSSKANFTANVTDANTIDNVNITITYSNGTVVFLNMTNFATPTYNTSHLLNPLPLGRFNFTIFAVDNASNQATATGWFNVTNSSGDEVATNNEINVTLSSPADNSTVTTLTPTFQWVYSHGAGVTGNCTLYVNGTKGGDINCTSGATTSLVINHSLVNLTSYPWFVQAKAGANETNSSEFDFTINITGTGAESTSGTTHELAYLFAFFIMIWLLCKIGADLVAKDNNFVAGAKVALYMFAFSFALLALNVGRQIAVGNGDNANIIEMFDIAWTIGIALTLLIAAGLVVWIAWTIIKMWGGFK